MPPPLEPLSTLNSVEAAESTSSQRHHHLSARHLSTTPARDVWTTKVAKHRESHETPSRFSCSFVCFVVQDLPSASSARLSASAVQAPQIAECAEDPAPRPETRRGAGVRSLPCSRRGISRRTGTETHRQAHRRASVGHGQGVQCGGVVISRGVYPHIILAGFQSTRTDRHP